VEWATTTMRILLGKPCNQIIVRLIIHYAPVVYAPVVCMIQNGIAAGIVRDSKWSRLQSSGLLRSAG
jgi:hypothetical protein